MSRGGNAPSRATERDVVAAGVVGLATAVRAGKLAAPDVLDIYLARIARHGPALNAFVSLDAAAARDAARKLDKRRPGARGALAGVPMAVKDNIDVAGLPTAAGIGALRTNVPTGDADCVARLRAAGAIILGKTLMDEAAFGATGDNPYFGRCRNPRRADCSPGGSSAGSAAAVAAGLVATALGSDTLGSVRIPASYCGCVGFKPTGGSVSTRGVVPLSVSLDHVGVLARSVRDCAAVYTAIRDDSRGTEHACPATQARIGALEGLAVPPEIAHAVERAVSILAKDGRGVHRCGPPGVDLTRLRRAGLLLTEAEAAVSLVNLLATAGSGVSRTLREALAYGAAQTPDRIAAARRLLLDAARWLDEVFASVALLVVPTTPHTAYPLDGPVPPNQAEFTALANAGGHPALSVPAGRSTDGLPLAVQIIGPRGSDSLVLAAGASCEEAFGPFPPSMLEN